MKSWIMRVLVLAMVVMFSIASFAAAQSQTSQPAGHPTEARTEANLILPDLGSVSFLGISGHNLLLSGLVVCVFGLIFGIVFYTQLKNLQVHRSMLEISELIYETCKTYLVTQGKFILLLEVFIGAIMVVYFGFLRHFEPLRVITILIFSLIGIAGSYGVAWFGIRINTFANSRTAFASLRGKPFPTYSIPLQGGHVDRHAADLDASS